MSKEMMKVGTVSMTTVEIAEQTGKRQDHVKRDAGAMLLELHGEDALPSFGESFTASNGQTYECYRLPKREVLVLVSGYSIPLRAAIIDRLEEIERLLKEEKPQGKVVGKAPTRSKIASDLQANLRIAKFFGLTGNPALLSANRMVVDAYSAHGVNPLIESGVKMLSEKQTQYFTPTQIGDRANLTSRDVNKELTRIGFQREVRNHKNHLSYEVTSAGKQYSQLIDSGRKHNNGSMITQIKWSMAVEPLVRASYTQNLFETKFV